MESDISTQKVVIDICRNLSKTILLSSKKIVIDCRVGKYLMMMTIKFLLEFKWGQLNSHLFD